ncbi:MAG: NAD(+) synthase [Oscillospiraceae bacterium]|nr:NAD(+) synthase [Oscillospiraceae bacterium]
MKNWKLETELRLEFIHGIVKAAGVNGIVFGNSGGKDSALVGILCKMACDNTVGIIMPCGTSQNYGSDKTDAEILAEQFNIDTRIVDLTSTRDELVATVGGNTKLTDSALSNIAPRLRMTALYAVAASENLLVAGTSNRSERHMGYFTKWGDGACDFNPIADLTVTETYEFLRYLNAPNVIIDKVPSAGLFEGQTDELDMGVTYRAIDNYLLTGEVSESDKAIIDRYHNSSEHKRKMPLTFVK